MLSWMWPSVVVAAGLYSGVDPNAIDLLGEPVYLAPQSGWTAPVLDKTPGTVRVWVGRSTEDAVSWYEEQVARIPGSHPALPVGAEAATGDAWAVVVFRDGNVAARVDRPGGEALDLAIRLVQALAPPTPWPEAPKVTVDARRAQVDGQWAQINIAAPVRFEAYLPKTVVLPRTANGEVQVPKDVTHLWVTAWDVFGRVVTTEWAIAE